MDGPICLFSANEIDDLYFVNGIAFPLLGFGSLWWCVTPFYFDPDTYWCGLSIIVKKSNNWSSLY